MSFIMGIVVGGLAGWLASRIMKSGSSLLWNIIVGVVGGALGGWIADFAGIHASGQGSFAVSVAGACLLIFLLRFIKNKL